MIFSNDIHFFVVGSNGFVASNLICNLRKIYSSNQITTIDKNSFGGLRISSSDDIDILCEYITKKIISHNNFFKKYFLINLISASNVDWCEMNQKESFFINYYYPKKLAENIATIDNVVFVNFSSNAVYDGDLPNYSETSIKKPVNEYGKQKARFDDYLLNSLYDFITIRPTTLFGNVNLSRSNPVIELCKKALFNEKVNLVDDLIVNFGYVEDLSRLMCLIFESDDVNFEINFGGMDSYSRYDLGKLIYQYFGRDLSLITRCSLSDFGQNVSRPKNTSFDCSLLNSYDLELTSVKDFLNNNYKHYI